MQSLTQSSTQDIHTLAQFVQQHVDAHWQAVFETNRDEILELFARIGDSAYGFYGQRLFQPVHEAFKAVGLRATPKLPGSLNASREWGPEDQRERWMWSKITRENGEAVGTLVTVFYHDHLEIRIPRAFRILALEVSSKGDVLKALSDLAPEFANAPDMKAEIAAYMAANAPD